MHTELFIDGAWREGEGEAFASHDPATGEKVWEGRAATEDDVAEAMAAARLALRFMAWMTGSGSFKASNRRDS